MKVIEMIEKLLTPVLVEIKNNDNHSICIANTDSELITPFLDKEVVEWTPSFPCARRFVIYIEDQYGIEADGGDAE